MTDSSMMQQQVRLGFRCTTDGGRAAVVGSVATGVLIWSAPAATFPPTRLPVANWCTVTTTDEMGTTFKFTRKGVYEFHAILQIALANTQVQLQLSLDSQFLTPLVNTTSALAAFIDYDMAAAGAAHFDSVKVSSTVHVTNTLRGSSTYATLAPAGTSQVGTVRVHASETALGTELQAASIDNTSQQLWCNGIAELFG